MSNFYQVGGSLPKEANSYVERQADKDFYDKLKNGEYCYVFNSRQMGKSSLRVRTMKNLMEKDGFVCAAIEMGEVCTTDSTLTSKQFYGGFAALLISKLQEQNLLNLEINVADWWEQEQKEIRNDVSILDNFLINKLLKGIDKKIIIFIDEIDSILRAKNFKDDFFALIRRCYNNRANNKDYQRLTFAFLGVVSPPDLISDKGRSPFNIGQRIELTGFKLEQTKPLQIGFQEKKVKNPEEVLKEILNWTGGQPFLTQFLCNLVLSSASSEAISGERVKNVIHGIVTSEIIVNWKAKDPQTHFTTIEERIKSSQTGSKNLLALYKIILENGEIEAKDSYKQIELRLSGLVVQKNNKLKVYNELYKQIFNLDWINKISGETVLGQIRQTVIQTIQPRVNLPNQARADFSKQALNSRVNLPNQARVDFSKQALNSNARVPELWVQDSGADKAEVYPLLGDCYILGRNSKSSDIVVRNPVVSQIHLSLSRDSTQRTPVFVIKDENSSNGIYRGKRRISSLELRHGDILTLGPPELAASVRLQYVDPPKWYIKTATWAACSVGVVIASMTLVIAVEWLKFPIKPLPKVIYDTAIINNHNEKTKIRDIQTNTHIYLKQLKDFGSYLPAAVIASEDSRYYWHFGVDPVGIWQYRTINKKQDNIPRSGTFTQQIARNMSQSYINESSFLSRNLRENIVALKIETFYSKDEILLTYLNRVAFGENVYGFEDAARYYFQKTVAELTLAEVATLVAIRSSSNSFNFCEDNSNNHQILQDRNLLLEQMLRMGKIQENDYNLAVDSAIEIIPSVCK